jgi:hypothetical protein
MAQQV